MNFIGIDSSLTSTAISLYNKEHGYKFFSYMKNYEKPSKWTKRIDNFVKITGVFYNKHDDYSEQEMLKMTDYQLLVSTILMDLQQYIIPGEIYVAQEGFSYNSQAGHLIDLVTLGTLLKDRLTNKMNAKMTIYSPSTLKKETCGLVYGWTQSGKRVIKYGTRSTKGIAGGNFKKHQMFEALYEYKKCDSELQKFVLEAYDEAYYMKKIPTPIDDLVDSYWLLKVLMNERIHKIFNIIN